MPINFHKNFKITISNKQQGAVWVEFLVAASFVLISLFTLIPILAKITDIRHKAEQSAQYSVWERTVGYNDVEDDGTAEKSDGVLTKEAQHRVLGDGDALVFTGQSIGSMEVDKFHYFLDGRSDVQNYTSFLGSRSSSPDQSLTISVDNYSQPQIGLITDAFDAALIGSPLGLTKVDELINQNGYYHSHAQMVVKNPSWLSAFTNDTTSMNISKSLLVDGWGAGGVDYNNRQVNKLQPRVFTVLPKSLLETYRDAFSSVPIIAEDLDKLNFDHVDSDLLLNSSQLGTY